ITLAPIHHKNLLRLFNTFSRNDSNEPYLSGPIHNLADNIKLLASVIELVFDKLQELRAGDDDHADAQIERPQHILARNGADLPHQLEDRQDGPTAFVNHYVDIGRQNARDVFDQSAAGDVGQAFDHAFVLDQSFERR